MHKVVAKFRIDETARQHWNPNAEKVTANAVSGGSAENQSFAAATPSGRIELQVNNPAVAGFFELGEEYYVTFEKAPKR